MSDPPTTATSSALPPPPRLLDQVREAAQRHGHVPAAVDRHVQWARRYILFHQKRHPREMGAAEIGQFYEHVVRTEADPVDRLEEASAGLEFLYRKVLHREPGEVTLPPPPRLLDRIRQAIRVRHYSPRTEECYVQWAARYIRFHGLRHPLRSSDLARGVARVALPDALARKCPRAAQELGWQFLFASLQLSRDARTGDVGRHYLYPAWPRAR